MHTFKLTFWSKIKFIIKLPNEKTYSSCICCWVRNKDNMDDKQHAERRGSEAKKTVFRKTDDPLFKDKKDDKYQ